MGHNQEDNTIIYELQVLKPQIPIHISFFFYFLFPESCSILTQDRLFGGKILDADTKFNFLNFVGVVLQAFFSKLP